MRVKGGHIVLTPGQEQPYKVVLDYEWGEHSEHPVATVCAGEALIRARLAPPPKEGVEALRQGPGAIPPACIVNSGETSE